MPKRRWVLLNPGPVNVTPRVRKALLGPDICHREPEFKELLSRSRSKLLSLFGIAKSHRVAFFTGSGTCALEAMISSFCSNDSKTLVLSNGVYGERIRKILELHALPHSVLNAPTGSFPSSAEIEKALGADKSIRSIAMVHHETSSGMLNPLGDIQRLAKTRGLYLLVDAISSMGAEAIDFSGIDLCAGVSGKCLHAFPGISFVLLSNRAAAELKNRPKKSLYLDLSNALEHGERNDTAFTPAVQILYAFESALDELKKESLARRIRSYREKSELLQNGLEKLGIRFLIPKAVRSHVLTALWTPDGISYEVLHDRLKKDGFVIYSGQSELKDKIFRLSNLGDVSKADLNRLLARLRAILGKRP